MHFPRHWARGTATVTGAGRRPHEFICWGWSDESARAAEALGQERARRLGERILAGDRPDRYHYGDRPLREEVLETVGDRKSDLRAVISRNTYGCRILNTASILFVDVDLPPATFVERLKYRLRALLGHPGPTTRQRHEAAALEKLRALLAADPHQGARIYRTAGGLRYLFTHALFEPRSDAVRALMARLDADPLYTQLCLAQESFRARLTPKPWRCGVAAPMERWPWAGPEAEMRFRRWEAVYGRAAREYATCDFVAALGDSRTHPAITDIVAVHDRQARATTRLPLA